MTVLKFNHVDFYRGDIKIIDDFNLSLDSGQILSLVGPSGCGKTTILRLAAGLEKPNKGDISLHGHIIASAHDMLPPQQRDCGMVFQDYALFPHMNVRHNIAYGLRGYDKKEQNKIIDEILELIELQDYQNHMITQLSGGQQQRVALARSIAPRPKILFLDEPFSGLDSRLRDQLRDFTLHMIKQSNISAILVTHDAEEAMYMADDIAVMHQGRILQYGNPQDIYQSPASQFIAGFFSETNHFKAIVRDNIIESPLGKITVDNSQDNDEVSIIIRPESIVLEPCQDALHIEKINHICAKVDAVRFLGRATLVHLTAQITIGHDSQDVHFHARLSGYIAIKAGSYYRIILDDKSLFVFDHHDNRLPSALLCNQINAA